MLALGIWEAFPSTPTHWPLWWKDEVGERMESTCAIYDLGDLRPVFWRLQSLNSYLDNQHNENAVGRGAAWGQ